MRTRHHYSDCPRVSVVIPSLDGWRGGNVRLLLSRLERQNLPPIEIITVANVFPNGKARNVGASFAKGDFLIFIDDDIIFDDPDLIVKLISPLIDRDDVGLTGASQTLPEGANAFQRSAAKQIPRLLFPLQKTLTDSDMVNHSCLAISSRLFRAMGGENTEIISGTDPDLRYRVRKAGFRVCIAPDCSVRHPIPKDLKALARIAYQKGKNSALTQKSHPKLVFELDGGYKKEFPLKRPFLFRLARAGFRFFAALFSLNLIFVSYLICYALGYASGFFSGLKDEKHT